LSPLAFAPRAGQAGEEISIIITSTSCDSGLFS
jgi:hypothetical protein